MCFCVSEMKTNRHNKGRRYSKEERKKIAQEVYDYNKQHGRGGLTHVVKTYNCSAVTVRRWLVEAGNTVCPSSEGDDLRKLALLADEVSSLKLELSKKEAEYEALKSRLV